MKPPPDQVSLSFEPAGRYVRRFHSPVLAVAARGLAFVSGSVVAVFVALTVLVGHRFSRS